MKPSLLVLPVLLLPLPGCSSAEVVPLCELAAEPGSFAGRQVTVDGTLLITRHGGALEDAACDRGIAISWGGKDDRIAKLNDTVNQRSDLPYRQGTKVRVTGEIRRVARSLMLNEPYWELRVNSAR